MMKIITATGKEFQTRWFGKSTIDDAFRARLIDESMNHAFSIFSNTEETQRITLVRDSMSTPEELTGYTILQGITAEGDGVVISLKDR